MLARPLERVLASDRGVRRFGDRREVGREGVADPQDAAVPVDVDLQRRVVDRQPAMALAQVDAGGPRDGREDRVRHLEIRDVGRRQPEHIELGAHEVERQDVGGSIASRRQIADGVVDRPGARRPPGGATAEIEVGGNLRVGDAGHENEG